jgi:RHS repeat-associated protein
VTATLTYDTLGRLWRVQKGAADTRFLTDGDAIVAEYDGGGIMTNHYVHGSNAAADDPLVWYVGANFATARHLHADHLGSIVGITNCNASAPCVDAYDEYGVPGAANVGRFQYTGQVLLSELGSAACPGVYYYKARIYSACLGRFLQIDPVGYTGGINIYAYVLNDPINMGDPGGLTGDCTGSNIDCGGGLASGASGFSTASPTGNPRNDVDWSRGAQGSNSQGDQSAAQDDGSTTGGLFQNAALDCCSHDYPIGPFYICPATSTCEAVIQEVFPWYIVPNLGRPVSNGQISPVYATNAGGLIGHVFTRVSQNGLSASNITMPGHFLRQGQVDLFNYRSNGGWWVGGHGYGTNVWGRGPINQVFGPGIFNGMLMEYVMVVRSRL